MHCPMDGQPVARGFEESISVYAVQLISIDGPLLEANNLHAMIVHG